MFGLRDGAGDNQVTIYSEFSQRIGSSIWPSSMRRLTPGPGFGQLLQGLGTWMPDLETFSLLEYGFVSGDDRLLRGIEWPKGLRQLAVRKGSSFDGVIVPSTVQVLHLHIT
ncbi:unnamed protein product [Ectocarpus sp. 6 AP-2014]